VTERLAGLGATPEPCIQERNRQVAKAQAEGGCVPASRCVIALGPISFPEVCFPTPAERNAVIDAIKAAEIEAAILEQVVEEATRPEANGPEAERDVTDAATDLETEQEGLGREHEAYVAERERADARTVWLRTRAAQLTQDRDHLRTLGQTLGIG